MRTLSLRVKMLSLALAASVATSVMAPVATAQVNDMSPILIVESVPSDNPDYRRMVTVSFVSGQTINVTYKAYNRAEFIQIPPYLSPDDIGNCVNGAATSLAMIEGFQRDEATLKQQRQVPKPARFCIKNIPEWEASNRDRYLDPIFNGMPHAASLNN